MEKAIAQRQPDPLGHGIKATAVGVVIPAGLDFDTWQEVGKQLSTLRGALMWYVGDWVNYGERNYGEKYSQAIEATGYDYSTVANAAYTAGRVQFSLRKEKLSWNHHHAVAALDQKDQVKWLNLAVEHNLTYRELRASIKAGKVLTQQQIDAITGRGSGVPNIKGFAVFFSKWKREEFLKDRDTWGVSVIEELKQSTDDAAEVNRWCIERLGPAPCPHPG